MLNSFTEAFTEVENLQQQEEVIPFGTAKIAVIKGRWTFNNKNLQSCNAPIQTVVSAFIKCTTFGLPLLLRARKRSYSDTLTGKTYYAHEHLREHNYVFPPTKMDHMAAGEVIFEKVGQHSQE